MPSGRVARTVTLPSAPAAYKKSGITYVATRTDRIVMDAASGALKVLQGSVYRIGFDKNVPEPPKVPEGYLRIAQVERRSDDGSMIPEERITDDRQPQEGRFGDTQGMHRAEQDGEDDE